MNKIDQKEIVAEIGMPVTVFYVSCAIVYRITEISKNGNVVTVQSHGMTKRFRRPKDKKSFWQGVANDRGLIAEVNVNQPEELRD